MSFEEFVQGCSPRLFRTALLLAGRDRAAAEDLLQLALERAYRHWGRVCRSGDPERYVRRILANAANDRWRRAIRRPERPLEPGDAGPVVEDHTEVVAERDFLIRALAGLPPRQRTVLVLRYYNDLSEAEIADVLGCSVGTVKSQVSRGLARRRHRRHVLRASVAGVASLAVVAVLIPAGTRLLGRLPGATGGQRPATSTVYVEFQTGLTSTIVPISAATNRPGQPIQLGGSMAVSPDGKTLYASPGAWTTPINTATNQPGKRIHVAGYLTINPDGKTAYAAGVLGGTITPVSLVTGKPGKPIRTGCGVLGAIVFTPDGKTAYVSCPSQGPSTVIPVSTASNTPDPAIQVGAGGREIAITPDGKTAYVLGLHTVTPIDTATNTPGKPIRVGADPTSLIAISPDGKTLYAAARDKVVPISTATNRPGQPIRLSYGLPGGIVTAP